MERTIVFGGIPGEVFLKVFRLQYGRLPRALPVTEGIFPKLVRLFGWKVVQWERPTAMVEYGGDGRIRIVSMDKGLEENLNRWVGVSSNTANKLDQRVRERYLGDNMS